MQIQLNINEEGKENGNRTEPARTSDKSGTNGNPNDNVVNQGDLNVNKEIDNAKKDINKKKKVKPTNNVNNEDYLSQYYQRLRINKIKRLAVIISILAFITVVVFFNIYYVFIKKDININDITNQVMKQANVNSYPAEDVQAYLDKYAYNLISEKLTYQNGSEVKDFTVSDVRVTRVSTKSNSNANVYFDCQINTSVGYGVHSFLIPLFYDKINGFQPSGDLIVCATSDNSSTEQIEESLWDFGKIKTYDKDTTLEVTNYITNFLEALYNTNADVSTFYSGNDITTLDSANCKFESINEVKYYTDTNSIGVNCQVAYTISSPEGIILNVTNYLLIEKDGNSYTIKKIY